MTSEKTIDEAAKPLLDKAKKDKVELVWDRFEKQGGKWPSSSNCEKNVELKNLS